MARYLRGNRYKKRKSRKILVIVLAVACVVLLAITTSFILWKKLTAEDNTSNQQVVQNEEKTSETPQEKPPLVDLQPVVDAWVAKQSATYGIVVYDLANERTIATHNPNEKFFAASLYKLFVAYLALADFQSADQNPDEILIQDQTKKQCVDKMIRESDSPCGEAMMAEMSQKTLKQRVSEMGIDNTAFTGIETTAQDCALILQYIVQGRDLTPQNIVFLRDAMHVQPQKYRNGLAKGAPEAMWDTKVGWNEQFNYHDVGIMTLPGGRQYVVAILSQNNGSPTPIADFAATIYAALSK